MNFKILLGLILSLTINTFTYADSKDLEKRYTEVLQSKNIKNAKDLKLDKITEFDKFLNTDADEYTKNFVIAKPAEQKETLYFNQEFKLVDKPVEKGFYREVLGKNEEDLIIAQDFFQDTKTPQTGPFVIKKDGDLKNSDASQAEGFMLWFNKNKKLVSAVNLDKQGKNISPVVFYKNSELYAQSYEQEQDDSIVIYYPNSKDILGIVVVAHNNPANGMIYYYFREDGSLLATTIFADGQANFLKMYNKKGKQMSISKRDLAELDKLNIMINERLVYISSTYTN